MFCFGFLYKFDVCMIEKKLLYCLFVYTNGSNRLFSLKFCDKSVLAILILKTVYLDNLTIISKIITIVVIVFIDNTVILFYVHLFYVPSTEQKMIRSTQHPGFYFYNAYTSSCEIAVT